MKLRTISKDVIVERPQVDVISHVNTVVAPALTGLRYRLEDSSTDRIVFKRRVLSGGMFLLGLLTFPIGILFWLGGRQEWRLTFTFAEAHGRTRMLVAGNGDDEVAAWLDCLDAWATSSSTG